MAGNPVAANLLMVLILVGGMLTYPIIKREIFPEISAGMIAVSVLYPGASPEEVENGICLRIEEEIEGLEGIRRITATAAEGAGQVTAETVPGKDHSDLLDEIKARVDAIENFPENAENPVVEDVVVRRQVLSVAVSGDAEEASLKRYAEKVRDDIAALEGITQVDLGFARPYEISVEVSEDALERHGLTIDLVARAVRQSSLELPGGSVKTAGGEVLFRTSGQAYTGGDFGDIVLMTRPDGTRVLLRDVATVRDGFRDTGEKAFFDGAPALLVRVFRVGDQNALHVADRVKEFVARASDSGRYPEGISLTVWEDDSVILRGRLSLLIRNGRTGLALVFLCLALFLRLRLAFWVALGIPISFLGAVWLMPTMGVSINLISLFGFIVVLGIVVDDAIVVGESIYSRLQRGERGVEASVQGALRVMTPVCFAVLTTIVTFTPLLTLPGTMGQVWRVIPLIVIPVLLLSLVESLFILPAHLSHVRLRDRATGLLSGWNRFQGKVDAGLQRVVRNYYRPGLDFALRWRYLTLAVGFATLLITVGLVGGGWLRFVFFPPVEADHIVSFLTMPKGTPAEVTEQMVSRLSDSADLLRREIEEDSPENAGAIRHGLVSVGAQPYRARAAHGPLGVAASFGGEHLAEVHLELSPSEGRKISSAYLARRWRELTGPIPDVEELTYTSSLFDAGQAIHVQLAGPDLAELREVSQEVQARIREYPGTLDVGDSFRLGKEEIRLSLRPEAEVLGITLIDLARQVRQAFYGEEVQRIQRGRDDVRVMVRYPENRRRSLGDLERMRIRTAGGVEVPFGTVAFAEKGRGYSAINRSDRKRVIDVIGDVDLSIASSNEIVRAVTTDVLPAVLRDHPDVSYSLEGEQKEQREMIDHLIRGFSVAMLFVFVLLAVPLKSYIQPIIVMSAIPFGIVGAIWGHIIMGMDLTILSLAGVVALSGVVVNDSLVLVHFVNRGVAEGKGTLEAAREAGVKRFRAIMLTSLTTFAGLSPMLFEKSVQAQFLIPLAVSLAFGVIFSTFITLGLVPVGYVVLEDVRRMAARITGRGQSPRTLPEAP
ncbi:MAG: acriflavin resistance protein [Gemmatimonadetes bacterium]|jgi:multidrug efflux pump subunit AcrB|nr:acriflavin resistance protein [Gemmatimonadota bacterium]